jgi:hypothetical protein
VRVGVVGGNTQSGFVVLDGLAAVAALVIEIGQIEVG